MMEESDDDRMRNPQLPSTYVTLVQLEQRWLQEKERKQREKEEREAEQERKEQKIHKEEEQEEAAEELRNQQQQQQIIESVPSLPRRNRPVYHWNRWVPCEKSCSTTIGRKPPVESSRFGAIVVKEDGISREADDYSKEKLRKKKKKKKKKKNGGRPRDVEEVEEELIGCTEHVEKEKILVVGSSGSKCEKEENGNKFEGNPRLFHRDMKKKWGNNKNKRVEEKDMANGREQEVLPERGNVESENVAVVVSTERECEKKENERKCEGSGGRRWNARLRRRGTKKDWGNNKNKRAEEEDKSNGREQEMLPKKENVKAENVAVVGSSGREGCGLEEGNGKNLVVSGGRVWENKNTRKVEEEQPRNGADQQVLPKEENVEAETVAVMVSTEGQGGVNGGRVWEKRVVGIVGSGYERNARNVNGSPRMMYGGVNSRSLMRRPRDLNLVWVRKEEGDTSDAVV